MNAWSVITVEFPVANEFLVLLQPICGDNCCSTCVLCVGWTTHSRYTDNYKIVRCIKFKIFLISFRIQGCRKIKTMNWYWLRFASYIQSLPKKRFCGNKISHIRDEISNNRQDCHVVCTDIYLSEWMVAAVRWTSWRPTLSLFRVHKRTEQVTGSLRSHCAQTSILTHKERRGSIWE
jgi:hypothetical protein